MGVLPAPPAQPAAAAAAACVLVVARAWRGRRRRCARLLARPLDLLLDLPPREAQLRARCVELTLQPVGPLHRLLRRRRRLRLSRLA